MAEEFEELLPFYALGAVTDEEKELVEAYAAANPQAARLLDEALAAASELAYAAAYPEGAQPAAPSPALRANVLAYARERPRIAARSAPPVTDAGSRVPVSDSLSWWQRFRQSMALPALAGLTAVLALLLLVWNLNLQNANEALDAQITLLEQQLLQQEAVLAMLPGSDSIAIAGTESRPQAAAQLVVAADGRRAVLFARDLQPLSSDQTYQLWFIGSEGPLGQGTFTVDERGQGTLTVAAQDPVRTFDAVGISIEPAEGSAAPTGDIVLFGELSPPAPSS